MRLLDANEIEILLKEAEEAEQAGAVSCSTETLDNNYILYYNI